MTPSEAPKALQASECSELLDPMRASCWISAQHKPGKFTHLCEVTDLLLDIVGSRAMHEGLIVFSSSAPHRSHRPATHQPRSFPSSNSTASGSERNSAASGSETSSVASGSETASGSEPSSLLRVAPRQVLLRVVPARQILLRNNAASGSETNSAAKQCCEWLRDKFCCEWFPRDKFRCKKLRTSPVPWELRLHCLSWRLRLWMRHPWRREFCCGCFRGRLLLWMRLRGVNLAGHVSARDI